MPHIIVCLLMVVLATPARATTYGEVEVIVESQPRDNSWHGYFEYVLLVSNRSAERTHVVTLKMPHDRRYTGLDAIRDLRRTVQVGPKETVRVALLQPDHPWLGGSDVGVTLDGRTQEAEVPLPANQTRLVGHYRGGRSGPTTLLSELLVLMSRNIPKKFRVAAPSGMGIPSIRGGMMPPGIPPPGAAHGARPPAPAAPVLPAIPANTQFPLAEPVEMWSGNWLAYSRYDGIVVTSDDLKALPAAARTALWQYVEAGGALLVLGPTNLDGLAVARRERTKAGMERIEAGFGVCFIGPDGNIDTWHDDRLSLLTKAWRETATPWMGQRNTTEANQAFPVVDDLSLPVKGLFVLLLLFTLTIGPLNFLVLAHRKRRIWLLWTTPVISFITCLAVFSYMLVSEGWRGSLRNETLTLLDEGTHRATTVGWTAVYSPLTPSEGLHFSYETEVVPQRTEWGGGAGSRACTIDWTREQHFASGWVEARVPAHFRVRKSESRRERIAIHREPDGGLSMVNGLGSEVKRFWYADEKRGLHAAENVAAGARAALKEEDGSEVGQIAGKPLPVVSPRTLFGGTWLPEIHSLPSHPSRVLPPRSYLAEMDETPFLEDALHDAKTRKCHALVLGHLPADIKGE